MAPNYNSYHRSLTAEIFSLQNRIRDIVPHWGTDGHWKEVVLRSVLRRYLPESVIIGNGFVAGPEWVSTQIDILVVDSNKPTLFKDGDLLIVTPDAVIAALEVKTKLDGEAQFREAIAKLTKIDSQCRRVTKTGEICTGLFVFDGTLNLQKTVLSAAAGAYEDTGRAIDYISCGPSLFVRYWDCGDDVNSAIPGSVWHSYELENMAPSYFIGNLVEAISSPENGVAGYAWFPAIGGKEEFRRYYLPIGQKAPIAY